MTNINLNQEIQSFLAAYHVMSLATCGVAGAHATNLFYACDGLALVWVSEPDTLCVPKTSSALIGRKNRLTSAYYDRAATFHICFLRPRIDGLPSHDAGKSNTQLAVY